MLLSRALRAASQKPVLEFITSTSSASGLTTYTFNSTSIGTESADRLVVVCASIAAGGASTINSMTIGGTAANLVVRSASGALNVAIFSLDVTTGTSANISFTASGACLCGAIHVFTIKKLQSQIAYDTDSANATAVNSLTLSTNYGSPVIALGHAGTGSGAFVSWNSPLETNGSQFPTSRASASGSVIARDTTVTVQSNYTTAAQGNALCCASWN